MLHTLLTTVQFFCAKNWEGLMTDETNTLDRPADVAGGGGRSNRRGGGSFSFEGGGSRSGAPAGDEFDRLAAMLERIGKTLRNLIHLEPPLLPEPLHSQFADVWPETQRHLNLVTGTLRGELPRNDKLHRKLKDAGLTGSMLRMKETSLFFYLDQVDEAVQNYSPKERPILTLVEDEGIVRRLLFLLKPSFKIMNSIMGSLTKAFPGIEIVKEVKEHVEAGYEAVERGREAINR